MNQFIPNITRAEDRQHAYRGDIDGLRGLAILAVVIFHAAPSTLKGGFNGVDVFFVISGYLITRIILEEDRRGDFRLLAFYGRRVRRIFPALLVVIASIMALGYLVMLQAEFDSLSQQATASLLFLSNMLSFSQVGYFNPVGELTPLLHLWSLSVEEQFYLLWPIVVVAARRTRSLGVALTTVAGLSLVCYLILKPSHPMAAFYLAPARFWELAAGGLIAAGVVDPLLRWADHRRLLPGIALLGLAMLAASFTLRDERNPWGFLTLLPVVGTALVIAIGPRSSLVSSFLASRPLVALGLISYPLYLWHWPLLSMASILYAGDPPLPAIGVAVALSIALAVATYLWVERPLRSQPLRVARPLIASAAAMCAVCGLIAWSGGISNSPGNQQPEINQGDIGQVEIYEYMERHFAPCTPRRIYESAITSGPFVRCFQSKASAPVDLAIIGDSHAEHLFIGVAEALPHRNVAFYSRADALSRGEEYVDILEAVTSSTSVRDVVVNMYWRSRGTEGLEEVIERLRAAGKNVFLTNDVPHFTFGPTRCKYDRIFGSHQCEMGSADADQDAIAISARLQMLAARHDVHFLDTFSLICGSRTCSMASDGQLLYRDDNHLSVPGSLLVGSFVANAIDQD